MCRANVLEITESGPNSDSAQSRYLNGNHLTMCQFSKASVNYKLLCSSITEIVDAPDHPSQLQGQEDNRETIKPARVSLQSTSKSGAKLDPLRMFRLSYYGKFCDPAFYTSYDINYHLSDAARSFQEVLQRTLPKPRLGLERAINTCVWVEDSAAFREWRDSKAQTNILLIVGPLGSGKTTLAQYLSESCEIFGSYISSRFSPFHQYPSKDMLV